MGFGRLGLHLSGPGNLKEWLISVKILTDFGHETRFSFTFVSMKWLRLLPNILTLTNLMLGTLAIIALSHGQVEQVMWLMAGSLVADILDGAIARRLGVGGGLGVQLDSLADMVTFGVLPALMIYYNAMTYARDWSAAGTYGIFASLVAVSAGLRLGRFNVDDRPREYFWGLATPAGAILVAGWTWAQYSDKAYGWGMADKPYLGWIVPVFLAVMFQVALKLPGLKSPKAGLVTAAILSVLVIAGVMIFGSIAVTAGMVGYVMLGLINLVLRWY